MACCHITGKYRTHGVYVSSSLPLENVNATCAHISVSAHHYSWLPQLFSSRLKLAAGAVTEEKVRIFFKRQLGAERQ